jgi:hypothetical protein
MDGADSLLQLGQQARAIEYATTHRGARKLAGQAVQCATAGLMSHQDGNFDGANAHAAKAAGYLKDAARLHVGTLVGETPSPQVLDAAHLGGAQQLHQDYVDSINEGKKNGR